MKLTTLYQFLGVLVFGVSICHGQECVSGDIVIQAKKKCLSEMSKDNECFCNCVEKNLDDLDDAGKIDEDKLRKGLDKWAGNATLLANCRKKLFCVLRED